MRCGNCGAELGESATFCTRCGARVVQDGQAPQPQAPQPQSPQAPQPQPQPQSQGPWGYSPQVPNAQPVQGAPAPGPTPGAGMPPVAPPNPYYASAAPSAARAPLSIDIARILVVVAGTIMAFLAVDNFASVLINIPNLASTARVGIGYFAGGSSAGGVILYIVLGIAFVACPALSVWHIVRLVRQGLASRAELVRATVYAIVTACLYLVLLLVGQAASSSSTAVYGTLNYSVQLFGSIGLTNLAWPVVAAALLGITLKRLPR